MSQAGAPTIIQDVFHRKNYKTNHVLGKGGFAVVYQVTDLYTQELFACKLTQKQKLTRKKFFEKFTSEIKIHRQLLHPHIVRVNNVFKDSINYYMLMELCNAGTLSDLVRRRQRGISEEEVQRICWELCQAYQYLKQHQIVHRDMKSSNVFLSTVGVPELEQHWSGRPPQALICKIGDFGLSVQLAAPDEKHFTLCGTPNFLPPETIISHIFKRIKLNRDCDQNIDAECQEICKQLVSKLQSTAGERAGYQPIESGHSFPSDMWSLGCILYSLFYTRPPFESNNIQNTYKKIVKGDYTINTRLNPNVSDSARHFIEQCLQVDPNDRMTIEQAVKHEWLDEGRNVKLKFLPIQVRDIDFNGQFNTPDLSKFLNYTSSIQERIQKFKDGTLEKEDFQQIPVPPAQPAVFQSQNQLPAYIRRAQQSQQWKSRTWDQRIDPAFRGAPCTFQEYLRKKYTRYEFITYCIDLPDPLKFTPIIQYYDMKDENIEHSSMVQFRQELPADLQPIVFNEYDFWAKFIRDQAAVEKSGILSLMHMHQQIFTLSWIDFSNRYGFAYQLSNGCVGVLFNDMSVVVLSPNLKYVDYIDLINYSQYKRNAIQIRQNEPHPEQQEKQQVIIRMKYGYIKDFLNEKKYKLIMYFKEYLENRSIQPILTEKRDNSDEFIHKYFDFLYDESCRIYASDVTEEQILTSYDARQQVMQQLDQIQDAPPQTPQHSYAIKMVHCRIYDQFLEDQLTKYVQSAHQKYGLENMFSQEQIVQYLNQRFQNILLYPQTYVKRYNLNEQVGTLCILYNSKVFQVNYPDHIKIIIAHKTVCLMNNRRDVLIYPSVYLKQAEFKFEELRMRISEARRLYELVRRARTE